MNTALPQWVTVDATAPITITVKRKDIKNGVVGDPAHCAIALAALRLPDVTEARIFRTKAWLMREPKDGARTIELFNLDRVGRIFIRAIDATGGAEPVAVTLLPRAKSETREGIKAKNERRRARRMAGIPVNPKYHNHGGARGSMTLAGVRRGTGAVPTP